MPVRMNAVRLAAPLTLALALAACGAYEESAEKEAVVAPEPDSNYADSMRSRDNEAAAPGADSESADRPVMQAQVILDRMGFSPGVIDGEMGKSTVNALRAFQQANGLDETGELDNATRGALLGTTALTEADPKIGADGAIDDSSPTPKPTSTRSGARAVPATRLVTIPAEFAVGRYEAIPDDPAEQAERSSLGYESLDEKLAERFHTTVDVLHRLNPEGDNPESEKAPAANGATGSESDTPGEVSPGPAGRFRAGQQIRVPNIGADFIDAAADMDRTWRDTLRNLGVGSDQPEAARIVVDKSDDTLIAFDEGGRIIAAFTVSSGSEHDPLPIGDWKILGTAYNPPFAYDPSLFWDVPDSDGKQQLPPGPNGPVGVVWIDLSKEHYGIHGTPEPQTIGRAQSHGCVRLTNWDAARLAQMVSPSTEVHFQP